MVAECEQIFDDDEKLICTDKDLIDPGNNRFNADVGGAKNSSVSHIKNFLLVFQCGTKAKTGSGIITGIMKLKVRCCKHSEFKLTLPKEGNGFHNLHGENTTLKDNTFFSHIKYQKYVHCKCI